MASEDRCINEIRLVNDRMTLKIVGRASRSYINSLHFSREPNDIQIIF